VAPDVPAAYLAGAGPGRFPFEFTVTGLTNGATYRFAVRAEDSASPPNEDGNAVVLAATPLVPLSTYASISVDGNRDDWAGIPAALSDPLGDGTPDVISLKVANDDDYLYLLVEYSGLFDTNNLNGSASTFLSIDTDANVFTGFNIYGLGLVGAEVSWQNDFPFAQDAGTYNLGATFTDGAAGIAPYYSNTSFQEYRVRRDATFTVGGGPAQAAFPHGTISLLVWTNHPSVAEVTGAVRYAFAAAPPPESRFAFIEIDGDPSDWAPLPAILSDPPGDGTQDILSMKVANDDDYLYVLLGYNGTVDTNTLNGSPSIFLSVDNDADPATGFDIFSLGSLGAEVSWQNDFAFAQSAGNFNLGATFTNATPGIAPYFSATSFQEYRIRRDAVYSAGGGPDQAVFPNAVVALAAWTNGAGSDFAGSPLYSFAANPGATAYAAWKLARFTPTELADPLASGDLADLDRDGIATVMEFALGLDPRVPDPGGLPRASLVTAGPDRHLAITFARRPPADGVAYIPESSPDMLTWNDNQAQFLEVSTSPLPNGLEEVTFRLTSAVPGGPFYLRLRVELE
ncbi:MAG: hypothetical protein HKO57_14270, partial [Akkermansiaceae bacterium]|nr:hypothetical protein [Akkermansiaceae bacterium]